MATPLHPVVRLLARRRRDCRSGSLRDHPAAMRAVTALGAFSVAEQAVWVTALVVASRRGGPVEAGWVSVALLVPAALVAPRAARRISAPAVRTPLATRVPLRPLFTECSRSGPSTRADASGMLGP